MKNKSRGSEFKFAGYAGYIHLSAADFAKASSALDKPEKQIKFIEDLLGQGYGISIKTNEDEGSVMVTLSGRDGCIPANHGLVMSSFAGNLHGALASTYYKHVTVCENGAWPKTEATGFG
jgi:hypothetical protein